MHDDDAVSAGSVDPVDNLRINALVSETITQDDKSIVLSETAPKLREEVQKDTSGVLRNLVKGSDKEKRSEVDRALVSPIWRQGVLNVGCKRQTDALVPPIPA